MNRNLSDCLWQPHGRPPDGEKPPLKRPTRFDPDISALWLLRTTMLGAILDTD